jgi:hypothetical protein
MYITNDKPNVAGLVLSGSADFKTELSQSDMFDPRLQAVVLGVVDVSYGEWLLCYVVTLCAANNSSGLSANFVVQGWGCFWSWSMLWWTGACTGGEAGSGGVVR